MPNTFNEEQDPQVASNVAACKGQPTLQFETTDCVMPNTFARHSMQMRLLHPPPVIRAESLRNGGHVPGFERM